MKHHAWHQNEPQHSKNELKHIICEGIYQISYDIDDLREVMQSIRDGPGCLARV